MAPASARSLKILAALVWYIGGIVLLQKGGSLLLEAEALRPGQTWPWFAIITGLFLGIVKARFLFSKSCRKNLTRIDGLQRPRIWQFFGPQFFVFLALMILAGATLSQMAHNNYPSMIGVAILDFSIGIALLGSSYIFWTHRTLVP